MFKYTQIWYGSYYYKKIKDDRKRRKRIYRKATAEYLNGNHLKSKILFEKSFEMGYSNKESIVNYSALLVSMGSFQEAIEWCEKYLNQYGDDYNLNLNLAIAYIIQIS